MGFQSLLVFIHASPPSPQALFILVPINTQALDFPGGATDENLPVDAGEGT